MYEIQITGLVNRPLFQYYASQKDAEAAARQIISSIREGYYVTIFVFGIGIYGDRIERIKFSTR